MGKTPAEIMKQSIKGWDLRDSDYERWAVALVPESRIAGKNCVLMQSTADVHEEPGDGFGHFTQRCGIDDFRGKRIRMTAWAKSDLPEGSLARLEVCVYGEWGWWCKWNGTFDNLGHNPIVGKTDWKQYALVVDALEGGIAMSFGLLISGPGKVWLDDFAFEIVDKDTPLTGLPSGPTNLRFEDED